MTKRAISIQLRPDLNELLQSTLDKHQIELNICASQNEARRAMLKENYCLAVIDTSAMATARAIESIADFRLDTYAPIVSVNEAEATKQILNAGADMCFSASVSPDMVVFHAMALLRRYTLYNHYDELKPGDAVLHRGVLMIDPIRHRVTLAGLEIYLQPREFRLLLHFARNPGIVVTPDRIGEVIWQNSYDHNRDVTAVIAELAVLLGAFYGLRRSEIVGLKWEAIDFKKNTITINHTVTSCNLDGKCVVLAKDTTKTKSSRRTLPLVPFFKEKLQHIKDQQETNKKLCGRSYNKEYLEYIYVDEIGDRIKPNYITGQFPKLLEKQGFRRIRFHDLRHRKHLIITRP